MQEMLQDAARDLKDQQMKIFDKHSEGYNSPNYRGLKNINDAVFIRKVPGIDIKEVIKINSFDQRDKTYEVPEQYRKITDYDQQLLEKLEIVNEEEIIEKIIEDRMELSEHYVVPVDPKRSEGLTELRILMPATMKLPQMLQELIDFLNTMGYDDVGFFI